MLLQETELKILSIKIFARYQDTIKPFELTTVSLEWAIVPSPSPALWEKYFDKDDINHDWGLLLDSPSPHSIHLGKRQKVPPPRSVPECPTLLDLVGWLRRLEQA